MKIERRSQDAIRACETRTEPESPALDNPADTGNSSVEPPSTVIVGVDSDHLLGIFRLPGRLVMVLDLDLDRVLTREERHALEQAA